MVKSLRDIKTKKWGQAHFFIRHYANRDAATEKMSQSPKDIKKEEEAGFTLIEMLVAMTIAAIFFAAFTAVVVATIQTMRTGDQRTVAQQNGRIAVNFLVDEIKQMSELEAPPFSEYRDQRTMGLPPNGECLGVNAAEVYPIIRRSTDGSMRGYIDLNHVDASGGVDEYEDFRDDGMPYDVRPLHMNKISFILNQSSYFPSTRYSSLNPDLPLGLIDLDSPSQDVGNNSENFQSAPIRVTYEHQKQPPRTGLLPDEGAVKDLYLTVFGVSGGGVNLLDKPFLLLRSFEMGNVTGGSNNDYYRNETFRYFDLIDADGNDLGVDLPADAPDLRQIVADHILDVRFRYFYVSGGTWIEIRYDPYTEHMAQNTGDMPNNVNDGYYRYFNPKGEEIFVWATADPGGSKIDIPTSDYVNEYRDNYPDHLTFMPINEFERGLLLFEGWRFVNTVMVTVRAFNQELQDEYFRTVAQEISSSASGSYDINHPDFGLGFLDFQQGPSYLNDFSGLNSSNPLWHAADSYREGVHLNPSDTYYGPDNGTYYPFDFVEPNSNPNFDPGRFVTLQSQVTPPILQVTAAHAARKLNFGLSYL